MNDEMHLVVFTLDDMQCALSLSKVERIERAVEISPLPMAPEIVLGIINIKGKIVPVVDLRKVLIRF
jgi:purine-binding chemotaxis protein CheW